MQTNIPLVSIITPTYNHEAYIEQCIESVLAQTFTDWEMIIINDGSTDGTALKAEKYQDSSHRIQLINQENVGVFRLGETYNKAFAVSKGKYIAILEGDDVWEPEKLERQVNEMERDNSIALAWGKVQLVNFDFTKVYYEAPEIKGSLNIYNNLPLGSIIELYLSGQFIPSLTILIRRSFLEKIGGFIQFPETPVVDFTTITELSQLSRFYFDNHLLGKWRIYPNQTTKKYTVEMYEGLKKFLEESLPKATNIDKTKRNEILNHFEQKCLMAYARSGRYKLIRKEFKGARKDYLNAIKYPIGGMMVWRLRASVGLLMSLFHMDVEWIAGILGKKTYEK